MLAPTSKVDPSMTKEAFLTSDRHVARLSSTCRGCRAQAALAWLGLLALSAVVLLLLGIPNFS